MFSGGNLKKKKPKAPIRRKPLTKGKGKGKAPPKGKSKSTSYMNRRSKFDQYIEEESKYNTVEEMIYTITAKYAESKKAEDNKKLVLLLKYLQIMSRLNASGFLKGGRGKVYTFLVPPIGVMETILKISEKNFEEGRLHLQSFIMNGKSTIKRISSKFDYELHPMAFSNYAILTKIERGKLVIESHSTGFKCTFAQVDLADNGVLYIPLPSTEKRLIIDPKSDMVSYTLQSRERRADKMQKRDKGKKMSGGSLLGDDDEEDAFNILNVGMSGGSISGPSNIVTLYKNKYSSRAGLTKLLNDYIGFSMNHYNLFPKQIINGAVIRAPVLTRSNFIAPLNFGLSYHKNPSIFAPSLLFNSGQPIVKRFVKSPFFMSSDTGTKNIERMQKYMNEIGSKIEKDKGEQTEFKAAYQTFTTALNDFIKTLGTTKGYDGTKFKEFVDDLHTNYKDLMKYLQTDSRNTQVFMSSLKNLLRGIAYKILVTDTKGEDEANISTFLRTYKSIVSIMDNIIYGNKKISATEIGNAFGLNLV